MRILHICNDFCGSKVHGNLARELDELGAEQTVYCPVRQENLLGKNQFNAKNISFVYSFCIRPWYKYVYHYKASKLYKDLKRNVNLKEVDFIHAHTLFSDGAVAYKAFKEYGVKYAVAVRSTDTDDFIGRRMFHAFPMGKKILLNASRIYFISASGKKQFVSSNFVKSILSKIESKFELRPNGIDKTWLENITHEGHSSKTICYVGTFIPRKNIERVALAIGELRKEDPYKNVKFRIIGGGGDANNKVAQLIAKHTDFIEYAGVIKDKEQLIASMRECGLFAMPSWGETFGLVYIEALSQNLPIIYSKNDGIDGFYDDSVGIAVDAYSIEEIKNAIKTILDNRSAYSNAKVDFNVFNWSEIATKYYNDYNSIINE